MKLTNTLLCLVLSTTFITPAAAKKEKTERADKAQKSVTAKQGYGSTKPKSLPAGLKKKLQRGESLPPGWQMKLTAGQIIDDEMLFHADSVSNLAEDGSVIVDFQGVKLKINKKSRQLLELLTQ